MSKKIIYSVILVACISFFSFREDCNNEDDETSFKKEFPGKSIPANGLEELSFSPLSNLLKI